ncbi:hypothetical protein M9H77_35656 [Catharanthus roseus]|uniref:Uncharacterized protein n=1 Tax=Catharanthus roseus TaxID=4058 RepID=A0ACB9ZQW4_CATRO|nr:hypothetical protein M9H77_35656 [Catharanthus roseus]
MSTQAQAPTPFGEESSNSQRDDPLRLIMQELQSLKDEMRDIRRDVTNLSNQQWEVSPHGSLNVTTPRSNGPFNCSRTTEFHQPLHFDEELHPLPYVCHPQTVGQIEVVNRTIDQLLRAILKKNLRQWEECLPHIEFAYNRAPHSTTSHSPFQVIYGFNPLTPFDLVPLSVDQALSKDASKEADFVKGIHAKVHEAIVNSNKNLVEKRNVGRRKVERFPQQRKSKLDDRGDRPFEILEKINDNAYKVDLPGHYNVMESRGKILFKRGR